jgi:predicted ATPase/DNA-binding CsgD family transcriptional regulator/DNA-binding XRE family transcriptional regulator
VVTVGGAEPSAIGGWLRRHRELAGLTQEELAARAGLTARAVSAIERGRRRRPYPHTVRALATALDLSPAEHADLLAVIAGSDATPAPAGPDALPSLPDSPTTLVGRDQAMADVRELLQGQRARLITLTGPGGVGKTTLALEVARQAVEAFADGVAFVALETLDDPSALESWIAARIGVAGGVAPQALHGYLAGREFLLVLDNFEHLLPAARSVAGLLAASSGLRVLVTSRAPLRLRGEREYPVGPLALPDLSRIPTPDELATSDAVQLFVDRARDWSPTFTLTQSNASAVAAICRRLDGLPLALELAAARLRVLSPTELLGRLDQALPLLTGGARDLPERQRTIRQAIEWSYRILEPDEQALFRRLGIFVGGWDAAAAEGLGMGPATLDLLTGLVEHSLVVVESIEGVTRYRMLETIREYARDQLVERGELDQVAARHVQYYAALAEQAVPHYFKEEEVHWLDRLEQDHANLRAAVLHATRTEDHLLLHLIAALGRYWVKRRDLGQERAWMETALRIIRQSPPSVEEATVLFNVGRMTWEQGRRNEGVALMRESLIDWQTVGDERGECRAAVNLAYILRIDGDTQEATALLHEVRDRLARLGDEPVWYSMALRLLGLMALERQDWVEAESLLDASLAVARESRYPWSIGTALHDLANLLHLRGDHLGALARFREGLQILLEERVYWTVSVEAFPLVAEVLVALGEMVRAARLFGAASSLGEVMSARFATPVPVIESQERARQAAREALGEETFDAHWRAGRALSPDQAFAEVSELTTRLSQAPASAMEPAAATVAPGASYPNGLTDREVEVLRLVAAGMTNAQVADQLYLSRRTVDAHLRRIFDKANVSTRTELARFGHEHGLI